jgi:hypothetical protein
MFRPCVCCTLYLLNNVLLELQSTMSSISGHSLIFQQVHNTKVHETPNEHNSLFTVNKITSRINKKKVHENELHQSFIDNNNLHNLSSYCTGTVIAYTQCKVENMEEDSGIIWS